MYTKEAPRSDNGRRLWTLLLAYRKLNHIWAKRASGRGRTKESSVEIGKPLTRLEERHVIESPTAVDVATSTAYVDKGVHITQQQTHVDKWIQALT